MVDLPNSLITRLTEIAASQVMRLRPPPPHPKILWHYTSGDALIKIITTGQLLATQISCTNDANEFRHAVDRLRDAAQRRFESISRPTDEDKAFFGFILKSLEQDVASRAGLFVACFSELGDDLSQWRAYSGGEGGFSIGFHGAWLWKLGQSKGAALLSVKYDDDDRSVASTLATEVLESIYQLFTEMLKERRNVTLEAWTEAFLQTAWGELSGLATIVKDGAFKAEKELRAVRWYQPDNDLAQLKFIARRTMISQHLPLAYPPENNESSRLLPIAQIVVGPSRHQELSKAAVENLLLQAAYPDDRRSVVLSKVPFRSL